MNIDEIVGDWSELSKKQWKEFLHKLEGPDGCDFQEDKEKGFTWKCKGGNDQTFAKKILKSMAIDPTVIDILLDKFHEHGGHCDCEILFNVAHKIMMTKKEREKIVRDQKKREKNEKKALKDLEKAAKSLKSIKKKYNV